MRADVEAVGVGKASRAREGGADSGRKEMESDDKRRSGMIGRAEGRDGFGLRKERATVVEGEGVRENVGEKSEEFGVGWEEIGGGEALRE